MSGQSSQNKDDQTAQMNKTMNLMMPIMTGFFTISLPSGMGIYWIVSNILQMAQQFVLSKYFDSKGDDFVVKVRDKNTNKRKKR